MLRRVFTVERGEVEWRASPERPRSQRTLLEVLAVAVALLSAGYLLLLWSLDALPIQDLPNHLARATVEADLLFHDGRRFGSMFAVDLELWPFVGGDLALAGLVAVFGSDVAGRLWLMAVAASLPLSLAAYLRTTGHSAYGVLLSFPLSLYLTTDWALLSGLHHYRLGLAFVLLALAAGHVWLRSGSVGAYVAWAGLLAVSYLLHLSALVLGAMGAASIALVSLAMRTTTWRRVVAGTLPVVALAVWQASYAGGAPDGDWSWGGLRKIVRLVSPYYRYDRLGDAALFLLFAAVCVLLLVRGRALRSDPRFVNAAALALVFLGTYAALPFESGRVYYIDSRALPLVAIFVLVASLAAVEHAPRRSTIAVVLAVLLAAANLAAISTPLIRHNAVMRQYRAVAAEIPAGARVLPVATAPHVGHVDMYLHAGAFATLEAGAMTPYLFSGGPNRFFRYLARPKGIVDEFWYQAGTTLDPHMRSAIVDQFDYLLVKKPYDPGRLPLPVQEVVGSESAALLKIIR
ncbi:hypothetical protein [Anaeromyxobacter terrae]|uniref:hypothetical protein n=1 Tax=Anaeromyxobacter terrae TaxID=2925406 RepID=UPI001F575651|nr:hypothetical protein [Anaeromyxobacter sp. SG22]